MSNIRSTELNNVIGRIKNCLDLHAFHEGQLSIVMQYTNDEALYNEAMKRYKYWDDKAYMISDMSGIEKSEDYDNRKMSENRYRLFEVLEQMELNKTAIDSAHAQLQALQTLNITSGEVRDNYFNRLSEIEKATDIITGAVNRFFDNETRYGE